LWTLNDFLFVDRYGRSWVNAEDTETLRTQRVDSRFTIHYSRFTTAMKPEEVRDRISEGVIAFPITPFKQDLSLDLPGLHHNLSKLLEHPVSAVVAAGGTGEMYSLTPAEHARVIELTTHAVDGRLPVIAGVGFNVRLATEMAQTAEKVGANAILAFPPYYPNADEKGLFNYYRSIASATALALIVYSRDWATFGPDSVQQLTEIEKFIAWKDGHGDIRRLQTIMNRVGDRLQWIGGAGDYMVAAYYSTGIRSFTSSIATVAPRLSLKLHQLASEGRSEELASLLQRAVIPLYEIRSRRKGYEVATMKSLMDMADLFGGPVRPPLVDVTPEEKLELKAILKEWEEFL